MARAPSTRDYAADCLDWTANLCSMNRPTDGAEDPELIAPPGRPPPELVQPSHPLLDAAVELVPPEKL